MNDQKQEKEGIEKLIPLIPGIVISVSFTSILCAFMWIMIAYGWTALLSILILIGFLFSILYLLFSFDNWEEEQDPESEDLRNYVYNQI